MGPRSADSGGGEIPGGGLSQYEDTALARVNALLPETRIAQQMMFEAVLRGENHIEAPCGLGKTALAGLLLAAQPLTWAGRLFVATSTRAQAEQAYGFAQEMVTAELADEAHLLLGAEQYLCNDRRQANGLQPLSGGTMRHEFPQEKDWSRSSHDPECCDANECMDDCYYEARARVVDARRAVVVVTHARAVYEHRFGTLKTHPGDLLLVDSGAQYQDGTTDVTRTIAIGEPTQEMRDRFTRVLRGHIAIARAVFPDGTTGAQLDTLARQFLWQAGLDFEHGTGHGVGSYLSVHEGPARISRLGTTPLRRGMILSNEPGYYKTDAFGIRIENLELVVAAEIAGAEKPMNAFETLTLAPLDRRLIDRRISKKEVKWLNDYHERVRREVRPHVDEATGAWLDAATAPIAYEDHFPG